MSDLLNPTGAPFTRVLIFRPGVNDSDKGPAVWSARSQKLVMATYAQRANLVLMDINHNMTEEAKALRLTAGIVQEPPTGGYCRLEADAQGLWMVPQYSDYARDKVTGKELRYPSPEFAYDTKTREVLDVMRISLVHEPATWGARLVASAANRRWSKGMPPEMVQKMMELGALLEKEQVSEAIRAAFGEVLAMAQGGAAPAATDLAAPEDPAKKDPTLPMAAKFATDPIARVRAQRLELENVSLCEAKIERLGAELRRSGAKDLTAAEEKAMLAYRDPAELERALALFKASDRVKPATVHREEEKKVPPKEGELPKAKPGGYVDALYRHFGVTQ